MGAVRFTTGSYDDIDAQAARLQGYGQQYQQLSRGRFQGWFASHEFGSKLGIHLEGTNRVLAQCGSTPAGHVTICFIGEESSPCIVDGESICIDDVAFWPSEHEFEARTTEQMTICVLDIAADIGAPLARLPWQSGQVPNSHIASGLRRLVRDGIREFSATPAPGASAAAVAGFTGSFVEAITDLISPLCESLEATMRVARPHKAQVFRRARDFIHEHLGDGVGIAEICSETGVGRRAMEYVFRSVVGIGPARYIRAVQLNQIRRDISDEQCDQPIGDVAARWGVWHWSRFSREYREAFGELPSETRARLARG